MLVYITSGQKTDITTINMDGLPLHHLSVGSGYLARRRAVRWLRELHASGVRRCVCADAALLPLAEQVDITPYPVLPLRLALLDGLLDVLCPGGLQNAAVLLRCGRGGEAAARAAAPVLYHSDDCAARQQLLWTSPRMPAPQPPAAEQLAAALLDAGKWFPSDIHITSLLDIHTKSHYIAT